MNNTINKTMFLMVRNRLFIREEKRSGTFLALVHLGMS